MRTIYLDCASGISGDMTLGALIDAGADLNAIQNGINSLGLPECELELTDVKRHAFRAAKITVKHPPEHAHRHLHHITEMIESSELTPTQQEMACQIFTKLGEAEAHVHGSTLRKVHFHEVGAVDSIADIVGVSIAIDLLGAERIICSPVPTGSGYIQIAHGRCSVPAPATAELLKGIPLAPSIVEAELTTPTGAAIVATVVDRFGAMPPMTIETIGYGAGDRDFEEQANVLRAIVGDSSPQQLASALGATEETSDRVAVIETNLDDVSGEIIGHTTEKLMDAGALDVYLTAIQMKKNRPGTKLTVLCELARVADFESIVFAETRSLGMRRWIAERTKLPREETQVETPWGPVTGKAITLPTGERAVTPEFEDCRRLAQQHDLPLVRVMEAARQTTLPSV